MYTHKEILPTDSHFLEKPTNPAEFKVINECEIKKCVDWVNQLALRKVCVQFSQDQLLYAPCVVHILEKALNKKLFVLGDTAYGSCCVDEVSAQHVNADGIIHFGHSCLSPSDRIPVLYIFGKNHIDIKEFLNCVQENFTKEDKILLLYDVSYHHTIEAITRSLDDYYKLVVAEVPLERKATSILCFGREIKLVFGTELSDYSIIYIGNDGPCAANFRSLLPHQPFFLYWPDTSRKLEKYDINLSKFLQKRMYLIECLKTAKTIGILIGTLCVTSYLKAVERIKHLTKRKGIKCYIISVGKINSAKLANFPEIDAYVLITCAENSLLNSKEFLQPIVTPYEVELAFNSSYKWSEKFVSDFTTLLPGGTHHVDESYEISGSEMNVSLISGNMECTFVNAHNEVSNSLVSKGLNNSAITESYGSSSLTSRIWRGLEQNLGETPVEKVSEGRRGLPSKYENECTE